MNEQEKINKMINAFKTKTIDSALESFTTEQNDEIVEVKSLIANLTNKNNIVIEETSSLYSQDTTVPY